MTFPMSYRPRFLGRLVTDEHGDMLLRKAFLNQMRRDNTTGTIRTALEHESFFYEVAEAVVPVIWNDEYTPDGNVDNVRTVVTDVALALNAHPGFPYTRNETVYLLSRGDHVNVLKVLKTMTADDMNNLFPYWDSSAGEAPADEQTEAVIKLWNAVSELVSIDVLHPTFLVTITQGGALNMPETSMQYDRDTSPFYVTRNALNEFGLKIPRHPFYPDDFTTVADIRYPKPADGITIVVTSSTDDVPDPDDSNKVKSEQNTLRITKGDTAMSRSLNSHDLKYHEWTFTVEETPEANNG